MRSAIYWSALLVLAAATCGRGGPVPGPSGQFHKLPGSSGGAAMPLELTRTFRGGERACVFVRGDHDPIVPLEVEVFDRHGSLVAKDESSKDFVAVFWVPDRTAEYRIVVRHHGVEYNQCYVVLK